MRATIGLRTRRLTLATIALLAVAHPWTFVQANGRENEDRHDRFANLRVIGLTDDGRLVRFRAGSPRRGTLTYTPPPAAAVAAAGLTGAAYTNNDLNQPGTATTLFDLDTMMDQVVIQSPPGNGILVATGKLGVDAGSQAGFDIYSRLVDGVAVANRGFASLIVDSKSGFYRISLLTGRATWLGTFDDTIVDIAIPLDQ